MALSSFDQRLLIAAVVVGLLILILLLRPLKVVHCPRCGGDLVEWSVTGVSNGFDVRVDWRGCPKDPRSRRGLAG